MDYKFYYPKIIHSFAGYKAQFKNYAARKLKPLKAQIEPYTEPTLAEISETKQYYLENAKEGWIRGRRLAKAQKRNSITSFIYKSGFAIAKTNVRPKDVIPIISCVLFSVTNPFVGLGILGFALGQKFNKQIAEGLKYIPKIIKRLK